MNASSYITNLGPEIILTLTACAVLMVGVFRNRTSGSVAAPLAIIGTLVALFVAWQNRTAIIQHDIPGIRVTDLTLYVRYITLAVGALILLVNWHLPVRQERDEFFSLILFSMTGVMLTAASNDLVVLFFALELVSVPTYALVAISREDVKAQESGVKYFFLGAMAAAMMAYGFSFLYGLAGTTVLFGADRSVAAYLSAPGSLPTLATVGLLLAVGGVAFKIAAVPLHVYAPDVYQGAASPVTGMLGFLPKLAGFVALIILFSLTGWELSWPLKWAVWIIAVATMTTGNVLALLQSNAKRMLAYSSIAHSGYMLIGILVGPIAGEGPLHDGLAAMMFYIAIYGVMNLGAFAVLAYVQVAGKEAEELDDLAGLSRHFPAASLALAICCFSLMGFPPTAGFLGKVYIFSSAFSVDAAGGFRTEMIWLAVIGVVNSAIAAAYYLRIIGVCYLRERHEAAESTGGRPLKLAIALCSLSLILLFAWPRTLLHTAQNATQDTLHPAPAQFVMEPKEAS